MPRLFVDCDETLVLWDDEHQNQDRTLWVRDKYKLNMPLIGDVNCFLDHHPEYHLVVWSGGGMDYAAGWARKAFGEQEYHKGLGEYPWVVLSKDMRIPQDQDICVDDMEGELSPRDKRVRVVHPDKFGRCPLCNEV